MVGHLVRFVLLVTAKVSTYWPLQFLKFDEFPYHRNLLAPNCPNYATPTISKLVTVNPPPLCIFRIFVSFASCR